MILCADTLKEQNVQGARIFTPHINEYHRLCCFAGGDRVQMAGACLAAGIRDPADFEGMQLRRVPELRALEVHE